MNDYNIPDPGTDAQGVFYNQELQALYDQLTALGSNSLLDAYTAGITIEDLDIADLESSASLTSNTDLLDLYEKLACGSRNHMRAFHDKIKGLGADYNPQFISMERFEEIIHGIHESCNP